MTSLRPKLLILIIGLLFLVYSKNQAQIIVVDARNLEDTALGFTGNVNFNFDLNSNTTQTLSGGGSSEFSFNWKRNSIISLNSYNVIFDVNATEDAAVNQGYQHFRYKHSFNHYISSASFLQIQNNPVLRIRQRFLAGAGPSFNLQPFSANNLFLGTMLMYEFEDELDTSAVHRDFRISLFVNYEWKINENVQAGGIVYYQPRLDLFRDFRYSGSFHLKFKIKENMNWMIIMNTLYDQFPVVDPDIPKLTYNLRNGLTISF